MCVLCCVLLFSSLCVLSSAVCSVSTNATAASGHPMGTPLLVLYFVVVVLLVLT